MESDASQVLLLKKLCRCLEEQRQKSHREAIEWQNFGRFTAAVLQREVDSLERKLRVLQEKLDAVVRENSELQDMCFYLDKSREGSKSRSDGPGENARNKFRDGKIRSRVPVHSLCAEEMNKDESPAPQYSGITSQNTLHDKRVNKFDILSTKGILPQYFTAIVLHYGLLCICRSTRCCGHATEASGETRV